MTQVEYLHVCDYAFNTEGGKACLIGIFDRLRVTALPMKYAAVAVALKVRGQSGAKLELAFSLRAPGSKKSLPTLKATVSLGPHGQSTFFLNIRNLTFRKYGAHTLTVSTGDEVLATTTVIVEPKGAQTARKTN
jgi:hypothetical protein